MGKRKIKSPPLSKQEINDIEISEKEIKEGKYKVFTNPEDFIKELRKKEKK